MCLFCKIVNGEIPSFKVYEDEDFLAFLDISQATKGHTLVIPKKHFDNIMELDDETASKMLVVVKKVAKQIKEKTNCEGINILNNNGEIAGQTIHHCHIHIIPRYSTNDVVMSFTSHDFDADKLQETLNQIK